MKKRFVTKIAAVGAALALALSGCSQEASKDNASGGGDKGTITLGFIPSWTDGLSTAYLLENQLTKLGYDVKMETITEAAILYSGLANGDVDIYPSAWPEVTHKQYMDEYGDKLEDLGAYYDNAKLTIAVPSYSNINSIEDLKGKASEFDGKIIGIEPGAGLTAQTKDKMMP
ncbi:glycine/betaine ABC transporter substrate-binding protein, partial [Burkholderia multivorans]